jgi:hypothetical protein
MTNADNRYHRVMEKLRDFSAEQDFERLCEMGADRDRLLQRLFALTSRPPEPIRLSRTMARSIAKRIDSTAKLIAELNGHRVDSHRILGDVLGEDYRTTLALPELLRAYAGRVKRLPDIAAEKWEPVRTGTMCQLIWYVKHSTSGYRDREVASLISATSNDEFSTEGLKQWRSRHKKEIRSLGPLEILPYLPRPPR